MVVRKIKYITLTLIISGSLFFLFSPEVFPENLQFQEILQSSKNEIVIIFNAGGWGNTPVEEAEDFASVIEGIQKTLKEWNLDSVVVSYQRTKEGYLGKITSIKEGFRSFQNQSKKLAKELEQFLKENPDRKIIMAGLSNGAAFVDQTMERLSTEAREKVYAVEAGVPFWEKPFLTENVLYLDNEGGDSLSKGELKILLSNLIKTPFKWLKAKFAGENLSLSQAMKAPGHEYFWNSSSVSSKVTFFLENKVIK